MPHLLISKVQWMEKYDGEKKVWRPWGKWAKAGNPPGERYNFRLQKDGLYYAHIVPNGSLNINKLDENAGDSLDGVTIAFVAPNPSGSRKEYLLVGYYTDATLFRDTIMPTKKARDLQYRASTRNAVLLAPENRTFEYDFRSRSKTFTYGDGQKFASDQILLDHIASQTSPLEPSVDAHGQNFSAEETRRLVYAARYERSSTRRLRDMKIKSDADLICEACSDIHKSDDQEARKRRFEVHHKAPVSMLRDGEVRSVIQEDLAVLCANCHRSIHATNEIKYISNIDAFRRDILGVPE